MKKIFIALFSFLILISSLQARKIEQMSDTKINKITKCVFKFSKIDRTVRKQITELKRYPRVLEKIVNSEELKDLFITNEEIKLDNFRQYKRNYRKMMKIFNKNNLEIKYKIKPYYAKALFNEKVLQATSYSKFKKIEKKMELIEIIINPVLKNNREIVMHCIEKVKN